MDEITRIISDLLKKPDVCAIDITNDLKTAGYIIVPISPTEEMWDAGEACDNNPTKEQWLDMECGDYEWTDIGNAGSGDHWFAMVEAWENRT